MKELSFDSETGEDYHETMRGYLRKFQEDEVWNLAVPMC